LRRLLRVLFRIDAEQLVRKLLLLVGHRVVGRRAGKISTVDDGNFDAPVRNTWVAAGLPRARCARDGGFAATPFAANVAPTAYARRGDNGRSANGLPALSEYSMRIDRRPGFLAGTPSSQHDQTACPRIEQARALLEVH
jgi:hypothetical protein